MGIFNLFHAALFQIHQGIFTPSTFFENYIYIRACELVEKESKPLYENEKIKISLSNGDISIWEKVVDSDLYVMYVEVYKTIHGNTVLCNLGNWLLYL